MIMEIFQFQKTFVVAEGRVSFVSNISYVKVSFLSYQNYAEAKKLLKLNQII